MMIAESANGVERISGIVDRMRRFASLSQGEVGEVEVNAVTGDALKMARGDRGQAAKLLGLATVPCLRFEHMTEDEKRAYVMADNKLALNAGWDEELLAEELGALLESPDLDFDVGVVGFSVAEIDAILEAPTPEEPGNPVDDVLPDSAPRRVCFGDVWQLGDHRLVCGDALDPDTVRLLMDGVQARMVFSDPPYNVPIDGHVGNSGKTQHREFAMAVGEMSAVQFTRFLETAFRNMAEVSQDGAIHYLCMDWRHMGEMLEAGQEVYTELKNLIVWVKDNGGMGTFYRSRHELIFAFKVGAVPHVNSFGLGQHGRYRTNVWEYRGANIEELHMHPTVKPVRMIADAIRDVSGRGQVVLDLFGGSGSTLIAAEKPDVGHGFSSLIRFIATRSSLGGRLTQGMMPNNLSAGGRRQRPRHWRRQNEQAFQGTRQGARRKTGLRSWLWQATERHPVQTGTIRQSAWPAEGGEEQTSGHA